MADFDCADKLRAHQVMLYRELVCTQRKDGTASKSFEDVLSGFAKPLISHPLTLDVTPQCSCGRFFEQNPTIIEDTEEERLEPFLHSLSLGYCKCLNANYKESRSSSAWKTSSKQWLHVAAALGSREMVEILLVNYRCDVNATTALYHFTALSLAVMQTRDNLVTWLCSQPGINLNVKSKNEKHTPLIEAMLAEKYHIVDILVASAGIDLDAKNFRQETPLIIAIRMNNARLVRALLASGANHSIVTADGVLPVFLAVSSSHQVMTEVVNAKVPLNNVDDNGESALTLAIRNCALQSAEILIRGGANCRANPALPALILATSLGHVRSVLFLLDIGQNPDQKDDYGWSALHYACMKGLTILVEVLLHYNADVNNVTKNMATPLSIALFHRFSTIAELLIVHGCEVNTFDDVLDTPLHYAAFNGNTDIVRTLLEKGAEASTINAAGATPLFNAVVANNTSIVRLLLPNYIDVGLDIASQGFSYGEWDSKTEHFFPLPRSLLWVASSNVNTEIVSLLLLAGYPASADEWIHDRDYPEPLSSFSNEMLMFKETLVDNASNPSRLMLLCRCVIRRALGPGRQRQVNQLGLMPRKIKNYISLRDL